MHEAEPLLGTEVKYPASRKRRTLTASSGKRWEENFTSSGREPEFPPLQSRQSSSNRTSRRHVLALHNDNPAKDLSNWLCSNGLGCLQCIRTKEVGILQRFGQVRRLDFTEPDNFLFIPLIFSNLVHETSSKWAFVHTVAMRSCCIPYFSSSAATGCNM